MDNKTISAISLKIIEVDINQGFSMVWLIEIKCTLNSGEIPIKVYTCASSIKINVSGFWNVIIVIIAWFGVLITSSTKNSIEIEIKVVVAKSCSIS